MKKILVCALLIPAIWAAEQGWYPHEGGLMKYRVNIRFGEEPDTMPEGWKFGRVSAVGTDTAGHVFVFRGRRGDLIKVLWWDGDGLCLFAKRLERGRFVWPQAESGTVSLTRAQLSMLLEGIDWRRPLRTSAPQMAV